MGRGVVDGGGRLRTNGKLFFFVGCRWTARRVGLQKVRSWITGRSHLDAGEALGKNILMIKNCKYEFSI